LEAKGVLRAVLVAVAAATARAGGVVAAAMVEAVRP